MKGQWIWLNDSVSSENERGFFVTEFVPKNKIDDVIVQISADTRYILYINGEEIGRGPIRSDKNTWFYDSYNISSLLKEEDNYIVVRVWNYGWSTYQSLASQGGLFFEVIQGDELLSCSNDKVKCQRDLGFQSNAVKRNVNLGFSDYVDATRFSYDIIKNPRCSKVWKNAVIQKKQWGELKKRPIKDYHSIIKYPETIEAVQEVKDGCQSVSVNTREAFFPGRTDANETIFSGFIGCVIESPVMQEGRISFPNRLWNGIIGDFKIDETLYPVTDKNRNIAVTLKEGRQLFLMQISGVVDDLFVHFEFCFEEKIKILPITDSTEFFVIGPTDRIVYQLDGKKDISFGVNKEKRLLNYTKEHKEIFASNSIDKLLQWKDRMIFIDKRYIFYDEYILSLTMNQKIQRELNIEEVHQGMLWNNQMVTQLQVPKEEANNRIIVDFKEQYVGSLEFTLFASAGCIMDIYCFENYYGGEIDYTLGLNNSVRYITREGWQTYQCMTRMGCRYAAITFRNQKTTVKIQNFSIRYMTLAPSNAGQFTCDDYLVNKIWDISKHTHLLCMEDTFTDSPTYEQAFWIGDAQVSSAINAYLYGEYDFIKWNLLLAKTAKNNTPLYNALTPTDWNASIPMWTFSWIISIHQYVINSGDESIIEMLYDSVRNVLFYYSGFISSDGAFSINAWNLIDWAPLDTYNYGIITAQQGTLAYCYKLGACFAEYLGKAEDKEAFNEFRKRLLSYIDTKLWNEKKQMFLDGETKEHGASRTVSIQTHMLLSLYDAIIDPKKLEITQGYLKNRPKEFIDVGSPFALFYLYEEWAKEGKYDDIIEDIKNRWGGMLYYDSTTCWEVFPGFYENGRTRSYCHGWSASPVYFMNKYILGIVNIGVGFKKIKVQIPECSLQWVRGSIPTPYGIIKAEWEKKDGKKVYCISLPSEIVIENEKDITFDLQIKHTINKGEERCIFR